MTPEQTTIATPAGEMSALWDCGCSAYSAYFTALANARSPYEIITANAILAADCVELAGLASAAMLRGRGLTTPTLTDA